MLSAQAIEERMEIQGRGAPKNKLRFKCVECPDDRGENGDLWAQRAEEANGDLRVLSARPIEPKNKLRFKGAGQGTWAIEERMEI